MKNLLPGQEDGSKEKLENEKISLKFNQNLTAKNDNLMFHCPGI